MIEYIGIPYSFRNYNCWHHAVKVRADNGIKTKNFRPRNISTAYEVITAQMQQLDHGLTRADTPEDYDVVITCKNAGERVVYHCGVYYQGDVSHCDGVRGQVVQEPLDTFTAEYGEPKFWR